MPVLSVRHLTRYRYRNPVAFGEHRMMFRPREGCDQRLLDSSLVILPAPSHLHHVQDVFGNWIGVARFSGRSDELSFESRITLEHTPLPLYDGEDDRADLSGGGTFEYPVDDFPDLAWSTQPLHEDGARAVAAWARRFVRDRGETHLRPMLADMTQAIYANLKYGKRLEHGVQTPLVTLQSHNGTCRDFAVLMIEAVRTLGLAAQFVSGYIHSPSRKAGLVERTGGGHTHAWLRVYLPSCGWVEFDPTNGIVGNTDLIRVAVVRDPRQATPLHGSWAGFPTDFLTMDVEVEVDEREDAAPLSSAPVAAFG